MSAPVAVPCGYKRARDNIDGADRLSSLPNCLLHHIMSFLPMPEVVRTSLLSPRWRYLWESTPFVRINPEDFDDGNHYHRSEQLPEFVDKLLLSRDGTVCCDEAWIHFTEDLDKTSLWIRHVIKHKVRLLHVSGSYGYGYCALDGTAICPSEHLKRIWLKEVTLYDSFVKRLYRDCPVLEHLELESCSLNVTEISLSSLKVLRIIRSAIMSDLLICAENLTHLDVIDPYGRDAVVTRDLSSLVSASISLRSNYPHPYDVGYHLLDGLSHATALELHAPSPELAFQRGVQACGEFRNLTRLVLGDWCMAAELHPLFQILSLSPKLKELTINLEMKHLEACKEVESVEKLSTWNYPWIEMIKIYCSKDDPRIDALKQALKPKILPPNEIIWCLN